MEYRTGESNEKESPCCSYLSFSVSPEPNDIQINDGCSDMCLFMLGIILMLNMICSVITGTGISISYMPNNDCDI
jgi:hypothetical protein